MKKVSEKNDIIYTDEKVETAESVKNFQWSTGDSLLVLMMTGSTSVNVIYRLENGEAI